MRTNESPLQGRLLLAAALATLTTFTFVPSGRANLLSAEATEDELSAAEFSDDPFYNIRLTSGLDFTTGNYGTSDSTDIWYAPFTTKLEAENHAFKLTVPYLSITDAGSVVGGGDQVIVVGDGTGGERRTEEGLGDIIGVASFYVFPGTESLPIVDLNYKIKFPTADKDRGLGTGEFDHSFEIDFSKAWGEATVFATAGYKIFGDPSGYDLDDVFYGSVGAQCSLSELTRVGLIYDIRDNTTPTSHGISEITGYLSRDLGEAWKFMLYGVGGLSDGSPDWGVGFTLTRLTDFESLGQLLDF